MILEAEANLVPMGPRSPLRSGRRRADIPRMSCAPSSARLRLLWGRCPWFKVSPPARSLQNRRPPDVLQPIFRMAPIVVGQVPMVQGLASGSWHEIPRTSLGLRSASVVAEQTSPRTSCNPSSAWLRLLWGRRTIGPRSRLCTPSSALKWGKLNYTDFVQNCILDQKERTSL